MATLALVQTRKIPGRHKRFGSLDTSTGHLKWFVGYCEHGSKVLVDRESFDSLKYNYYREQRSLQYRILKAMLAHYS